MNREQRRQAERIARRGARSTPQRESEREYFDLACERITRAQAQGKLLPPDPRLEAVQAALLPANPDFDDPQPRH